MCGRRQPCRPRRLSRRLPLLPMTWRRSRFRLLFSQATSCGTVFCGGEQTILLALFGVVLTLLVIFADRPVGTTFGAVPLGPVVMFGLLGIALRRAWCCGDRRRFSANFCETILATGD